MPMPITGETSVYKVVHSLRQLWHLTQNLQADMGYGAVRVDRNSVDQTGLTASAFNAIDFTRTVFDPDSVYNLSTDRYQPLVPGIYQFNMSVRAVASAGGESPSAMVRKTGAENIEGNYIGAGLGAGAAVHMNASGLVNLNGSTDYLEPMVWMPAGVTTLNGSVNETFFTAHLVRRTG